MRSFLNYGIIFIEKHLVVKLWFNIFALLNKTRAMNEQKEKQTPEKPAPVTVTLDEAKKMDRQLTLNDSLIVFEHKKQEKK